MTAKKGSIKVSTTDIFPIIKKWLYSEHDIFLRELISNASDAITKRATLARTENLETAAGQITVEIEKTNKVIKISDNGLGMTQEEVEKYIAQLAFSGAEEFVEKMKEQNQSESKDDIIGKFGLGFYSAFMVADKVVIDSLSYRPGSKATRWICQGDTEYEFEDSNKQDIGTTITLYINDEGKDFLETYKTRGTLAQYCDFMPYPIELVDIEGRQRTIEENLKAEKEEDKKPLEVDIVNDTEPLWKKDPSSIKDEEYISFFQKMFPMEQKPLFWIHLNIDHPFTLQGILYFPKLNPNRQNNESNIRLYSKQVFVSDNVKNIIPEFLSLLKGAIDSTDIPLNVSRSALQGDPNIKKISNYIVKKVADTLKKRFTQDRKKFEESWEDIGLFVKYGIISEPKFDELMRKQLLFKNFKNEFLTLEEYKNSVPEAYREKMGDNVLYYEKGQADTNLIQQVQDLNIHTIETDQYIDPHLMQHIEFQKQGELEFKFASIDTEFENLVGTEETNDEDNKIKELFEGILKNLKDEMTSVELKKLKDSHSSAYFKVDQQTRRFQQMTKTMGQTAFDAPVKKTLVVNPGHPLIKNAFKLSQNQDKKQLAEKILTHVRDLASFSANSLQENQESKEDFVKRSQDILSELSKLAL
jgi:molecular chaperone HtpG